MRRLHRVLLAAGAVTVAAAYADPGAAPANSAGSDATHLARPANGEGLSQPIKDAYLKGRVVSALSFDPHIRVFDFTVEVENGQVVLSGGVDTEVERDLAVEIARGVEDVKDVRSDIGIKPGTRAAREASLRHDLDQKFDDIGTTTGVKAKLLANQSTSGLAINVTTRNGVVTLSGKAGSSAEKDLAERIAENTSGVLDVRNQLEVATR